MNYSIQLYSLYDLTDKDLEGVLRTVAEIGYKSVEFAGYFGHSAETIRGWLDKYGLTCSGTHTVYPAIVQDFEGQVAFHKTLGTKDIIIPGFRFTTEEELDAFIDFANEYGPKLAAEGLRLSFHNHSKEFIPTEYGKIVEDEIINRTNISLEIDTFWAFNAGKDPVALMEQLKDRLVFIHVKDGFVGGVGAPLGQGDAPVAAVYQKAVELGIPMVVESENHQPDSVTEVRTCYEYLKSLEK